MEIDIRDDSSEEVTHIRFAHDSEEHACKIENRDDGFVIVDCDDISEGYISSTSIDNLIKALQKAKEIW